MPSCILRGDHIYTRFEISNMAENIHDITSAKNIKLPDLWFSYFGLPDIFDCDILGMTYLLGEGGGGASLFNCIIFL